MEDHSGILFQIRTAALLGATIQAEIGKAGRNASGTVHEAPQGEQAGIMGLHREIMVRHFLEGAVFTDPVRIQYPEPVPPLFNPDSRVFQVLGQ